LSDLLTIENLGEMMMMQRRGQETRSGPWGKARG
jgi:hypothetical protein